ncbi:hypothetical protein LMJ86_02125, partial [Escherichia coli]|nr:hypothetical protein [Escherichia coli]
KTSIFSHPVYLFLRKFSLQDSRGGSDNDGSIIVDEDDNPVMVMEDIIERVEITPAGSRWGVRPDLLFYIEAAWQRREIERIKARLDLIEGKH